MSILNCKGLAKKIQDQVKESITSNGYTPGLAVIIIGDRPDSILYVNKKKEMCEKVGIKSKIVQLSSTVSQENVLAMITAFNDDPEVHGILIQLPLPEHLNEEKILHRVKLEKDVDGFHATNMGFLAMEKRVPKFIPCTPKGCMTLLKEENIELQGKHVVVVGKSNVVGLPVSLLMMKENATVTVCNVHTQNLKDLTKQADILVSCCGQAEMIKGEDLKEGVVVIDIGINYKPDSSKKSGRKLVGDVHFESAQKVASKITPVPGGMGVITVATLMENTLTAYKNTLV